MTLLECECAGNPAYPGSTCGARVTQEDFLCDHCRTIECWTRTTEEMADLTLCYRLGCPEHMVPGSRPVEPMTAAARAKQPRP